MNNYYNIQIFSLSIILICLFASSKAAINFRKLESTSKIALKVNEIGMQFILNKSFRPLPNKILVNGKEIDKIDCQINLTEANSLIELFWNETVTNCHAMFAKMSNISYINFTDFDTSKVTNMSNMFMNCESLEELDLSSFDTSNVMDMSKMFSKCYNLENLKINNFKTEKVTNMERMFEICVNLEYLDIHNFNTISVTNMDYMFHSCSNLKNLDLSQFNTSSVKSMMAMFASCLSLYTLNLSYFDFSNTVNSAYMFFDSNIMILDLSNFNGESIIFKDDILKFNPNLKFIGLKNYNGKDIFNSLDADSEIIICADNDTMKFESNLLSLKEKNIINNCSDYCFSEFSKIKEDKGGCEIDCSKIENEENIYYYLCKNDSIISDTANIGETISESIDTSNIESTIISDSVTNKETIFSDSTNIKETITPESTNVEEIIISDTITNKQTILQETTNVETIIQTDNTTMKQTILPDTTNVEETIITDSTTIKHSTIPETTNIEKILPSDTTIKQTILPQTTNIEKALPLDTTIKQTILLKTTNIEKTLPPDTTIKQTILPYTTNIEKTIQSDITTINQTILLGTTNIHKTIPGTTIIKTTILPETTINKPNILPDTTNIEKTIPSTTNIKPAILPNATNTEPTILPQTNILSNTISTIYNKDSMPNKYTITLIGYDNYNFQNNLITFSIYFLKINGFIFPKSIFFTIDIIFEYIVRNLDELSNQNLTCSFEEEKKLAKYNCRSNPLEKMNIMKITANNDFNFNFNNSYDLIIIPFAQFNRDKIVNQTGNFISSKEIIFFYGNLTQENDYFKVKGKLDEESQLDNQFNLSVYSNTSNQIQILCETINEKFDNFEIKCEKDESVDFNINNSISFMESKNLFVIVDGEDKVFMKTSNNTEKLKTNKIYSKKNSSLSPGIIAVIVIALAIVCILAGLMIIFRKKLFKKNGLYSNTKDKSETYVDLKISNLKV